MQSSFPKDEEKFNRFLVREYFKEGTVEAVFKKYRFSLPVSYATYQRVLDKYGVVKTAGPNSKLTEAVSFLSHLAKDNIALEDLYKKMPSSFQTSVSTLYRILGYVKEGITRRVGTALVLTPYNNKTKILLGLDCSKPRIELGKPWGATSLPMGFSRKRDSRKTSVLRILQQEVLTEKVIKRTFPEDLVSGDLEPFMYLDIADVRVAIYHLQLSKELSSLRNFQSYKIQNYSFQTIEEILERKNGQYRAGIVEAVRGYKKHLGLVNRNLVVNPLQATSLLNKDLATVTVDIES